MELVDKFYIKDSKTGYFLNQSGHLEESSLFSANIKSFETKELATAALVHDAEIVKIQRPK